MPEQSHSPDPVLRLISQDEPPPKSSKPKDEPLVAEGKKGKKKIRKSKAVEDDGEDGTVVKRRYDKRKRDEPEGPTGRDADEEEDGEAEAARQREEARQRDQRCEEEQGTGKRVAKEGEGG